jgi:hypothetical protein
MRASSSADAASSLSVRQLLAPIVSAYAITERVLIAFVLDSYLLLDAPPSVQYCRALSDAMMLGASSR